MIRSALRLALVAAVTLASVQPLPACTNILVTPTASTDGSTFITYAADSHDLYGELYFTPGAVFPQGAMRDVYEWDTGKFLGRIPQPAKTYTVVGNMNEHQVAIGETTYGGRSELGEPNGIVDYGSLMYIALERATTAREAIQVMTDLVAEFGYASSGESFSISDPEEVWLLEMIGKGKDVKGAVWVARKVPEGFICAHANQARIRQFPLDDSETTLYAPDVITFARDKEWFDGEDEDFSFADTYAPLDFGAIRFCEARVWSAFRRAAPTLDLPVERIMGSVDQEPLPLFIKPDAKLSAADVMALMRDHFEGTPLDMSKDIGAGPYARPYRWRPLTWEVDEVGYANERAISTQQTGFSFVAQARSWLPDAIGGVLWFGLDDTFMTVYTPMYAGMRSVPPSFGEGVASMTKFSWDSAFWVFNWVSNYTYSRYSDMIVEVLTVQQELEGGFLARQNDVEAAAVALYEQSPELARDYVTKYSVEQGEAVTARWTRLGQDLLVKYMDGNVKDEYGAAQHPAQPESWYRCIVEDNGEILREIKNEEETEGDS
ncbi:MAG: dipeptidase [bacterium]|nr:dipeptidase [bacterium]